MVARRQKKKARLFHATFMVVRLEEWCVEAETAEEARAYFGLGAGHRCGPGEHHFTLNLIVSSTKNNLLLAAQT